MQNLVKNNRIYLHKKKFFTNFAQIFELTMKKLAIFSMALMALVGASCQKAEEGKAPITKPQITIEGGRLTPEGLWAMGRIGSVKSDIETGLLAYTVSYYSVEENRSTTWIRICNPFENMQVCDEFVGSEPAWFGNSGCLAYMKSGQLYFRRDGEEVKVEGAEDIEGFLLSPMRDKIILVKLVKTVPTTADKYPDLPLATGHMHEDLMYKHWDEWTETAPQPFVYELQTEYYGEGERMKCWHGTRTTKRSLIPAARKRDSTTPFRPTAIYTYLIYVRVRTRILPPTTRATTRIRLIHRTASGSLGSPWSTTGMRATRTG